MIYFIMMYDDKIRRKSIQKTVRIKIKFKQMRSAIIYTACYEDLNNIF